MGLASALNTALTGLTAAETTIDVVGNNLANSATIGFKSSTAEFATQFLQTQSLGSAPVGNGGGTNPRQIGLGTQVAEITPNFTQGTIEISSNPSDLAIQGDGFFIVQSGAGEHLYTRNGSFKTNSQNELVTTTGDKLLGFGVDSNFQVQTTALQALTIPLGSTAVAQATKNVFFQGTLTPTGELADTAEILQSAVLGDGKFSFPPDATTINAAVAPDISAVAGSASGAGTLDGSYNYRVVFVDASGNETEAATKTITVAGPSGIDLSNLPLDASGTYVGRRIYRSVELSTLPVGASPTYYLDKDLSTDNTSASLSASALGVDTTSDAALVTNTAFDSAEITGNYTYRVTWVKAGEPESRPSGTIGPINVSNGRVVLSTLPTPTGQYAGGQIRVYRNVAGQPDTFYRVAEVNPGDSFVDHVSDTAITNTAGPSYEVLDLDGPKILNNTLLTDVKQRDGNTYSTVFKEGALTFTGAKGGRTLGTKTLVIKGASDPNPTTVQDLLDFMTQSLGIAAASDDAAHPIPNDITGQSPGGSVLTNGRIQLVANNGVDNAVGIPLSAFKLTPTDNSGLQTPNLSFGTSQNAKGQSAAADFIVYDSLGIPLNVRVTTVLQSRDSTSTTYRWIADSSDNEPASGNKIGVGTGLITFDGQGNVVSVSNSTVSIDRSDVSSISPLEFKLDFTSLSGLAANSSTLAASRQDGSGAGTLSSFIIGEDGGIRGVFSNGITRALGQIRIARFSNPDGLESRGQNAYAAGVNSGLPVEGNPGTQGIGSIVAGAVELSNTDIGKNLIQLILASTAYRGNTRVVTTVDQMLDELLNLRR